MSEAEGRRGPLAPHSMIIDAASCAPCSSDRAELSRLQAKADLRRAGPREVGGIAISEHGRLARPSPHRAEHQGKRLALVARHHDPYERKPPESEPERHIDAHRPGEKVGLDCFYVSRLSEPRAPSGTTRPATWPPALPGGGSPLGAKPEVRHTRERVRPWPVSSKRRTGGSSR